MAVPAPGPSAGGSRLRRAVAAALVVGFSSGFALLVGEGAARLVREDPWDRTVRLLMRSDPLLGWSKVPGASGVLVTDEYEVAERFNSRGIRGPEYALAKPEGEFRVGLLGDSFTEGYTVSFDSLVSEVLESELRAAGGRPVEVINFGTAGYSTDQELLLYLTEARLYELDVVVLMFYFNDVWFNAQGAYWRGPKPRFEVRTGPEGADLVLTSVPGGAGAARAAGLGELLEAGAEDTGSAPAAAPEAETDAFSEPRSIGSRAVWWLRDHSRLVQLASQVLPTLPPVRAVAQRVGWVPERELPRVPDEHRLWKREPDPDIEGAWRLTELLLARLRDEVARDGARLIVFGIPHHAAVYPERWAEGAAEWGVSTEAWFPDEELRDLGDVLDRLGVEYVNPLAEYREEARRTRATGDTPYLRSDPHWNGLGHRLAGLILAREILRGDLAN